MDMYEYDAAKDKAFLQGLKDIDKAKNDPKARNQTTSASRAGQARATGLATAFAAATLFTTASRRDPSASCRVHVRPRSTGMPMAAK